MHSDPILLEAARSRIRPFAVRAARAGAARSGLASLDDEEFVKIMGIIDAAAMRAEDGLLPDFGTMSENQFHQKMLEIYQPMLGDSATTEELAGLGKKLKKLGKKITGAAKKITKKVVAVHKKIIKKVVTPVVAPTLHRKLQQRDKFKAQAAAAYARWIASGETDQKAYEEYIYAKGMADKRLDTVQKHIRTAGAVVAAVAGGMAAKAALTKVGGEMVADKLADKLAPDTEEAVEAYADSAENLNAPDAGAPEKSDAPLSPVATALAWAAPAAAALLLI